MFALGIAPTNGLYFTMARILRGKGLPFPLWNWGIFTALSSFQRVIREELRPERRASYRWLAIGFYAARPWQNSNCAPTYSRAPHVMSVRPRARAAQLNRGALGSVTGSGRGSFLRLFS